MDKPTPIYFPRWIAVLYGILAVVLIPWIFGLAVNLPSKHLARHWDAVWVGFDIIMLLALAATLYFAIKRVVWVAVSATALATLLVVDVWFDVLTSKPGGEEKAALIFGALELALAILTFRLVYRIVHQTTTSRQNIRIRANRNRG